MPRGCDFKKISCKFLSTYERKMVVQYSLFFFHTSHPKPENNFVLFLGFPNHHDRQDETNRGVATRFIFVFDTHLGGQVVKGDKCRKVSSRLKYL